MRTKSIIALLGVLLASQLSAHPTDIPYASRGECESAYAKFSKLDRERLNQIPGVTPGEAQRTFRDLFVCEYDRDAKAWFIVHVDAD